MDLSLRTLASLLLCLCIIVATLPTTLAFKLKQGCSTTTLANTAHLKSLSTYPRSKEEPFKNNVEFCKFKKSCCSDATLRAMRGEFVLGDYTYSTMEFLQEKARQHPEELYMLLMKSVAMSAPEMFKKLEANGAELRLIEDVMKEMDVGAKAMEDAFYTFWGAHLGYVTGLMCSLCEVDTSHFLKITDDKHAELLLRPGTCDDLYSKFIAFLDSIPGFFHNKHVKGALEKLAKEFSLTVPIEAVLAFVTTDTLRTAVCGGVDKCKSFICEKTYRGLGMDAAPFVNNLIRFIQDECHKTSMCNNPALNHTISELQKLSKESLNSEGMNVTNKYDNHGYDALEIGCKSSLSEHACHVADVDKDVLPKQKKSGSAFGTFVLVLFILGALAGGGFYVYKKKFARDEPLNLYSSLS